MSEQQVPDKVTVTVAMHYRDEMSGQTVEALPVPAAAFLRAVADMLDPPRKPMRPTRGMVNVPDRAQGGIIRSPQPMVFERDPDEIIVMEQRAASAAVGPMSKGTETR